ncbi:MAG: hypothetical protein ACREXP_19800 [Steroidobacteraceae bacterium]
MSYQPVLYCTHRPGPPLDRFVEQLWYWEGVPLAHAKDRLLPKRPVRPDHQSLRRRNAQLQRRAR